MPRCLLNRWPVRSLHVPRSPPRRLSVNHFNGPTTYSSEGFLNRNLDSLNPDFVYLLSGSMAGTADSAEGAGSINPFIKGIFSAKAIVTQTHPKNEDTIVSAQQPAKSICAPSTCRKGTIKRLPALHQDATVAKEQDQEEDEGPNQAEAGIDVHSIGDPYAPYTSPGLPPDDYVDPSNQASSQAHVPLAANASPFQRSDFYDDEYEDRKSVNSYYGSESYAPSRNMFQDVDKEGLIAKEALAGEIMENETTEVVKETSAHRRWVLLYWLLTWWILSPFKWFGRMKRQDIRQAWWEKLTLNFIIWFICVCAVFVIAILGLVICPTEHVFSTSELASHSYSNSPNNIHTAIHGEVFDLTLWVQLSTANVTDVNAQYHDFRAITNNRLY